MLVLNKLQSKNDKLKIYILSNFKKISDMTSNKKYCILMNILQDEANLKTRIL